MNNISIDFNNKYNKNNWLNFLKSNFLPDDFEIIDETVELEFSPKFIDKNVTLLGSSDSLNLKVYEVRHKSENDPRIGLTRDAFRLMNEYILKNALMLFISTNSDNYRFSLITRDLKLEGKKIIKEYSNPRRYSYFLGPEAKVHTPYQFLVLKGRIKNEEDLLNRFSIEVVNKKFYNEIAFLFTKLTGGIRKVKNRNEKFEPLLKLPSTQDHETLQRFGVRLIGRIIFNWFLKKKKSVKNIPLIPENILSVKAVENNPNYYHSILEPLFFEVLNTPIKNRKSFIKQEKKWENIPFLNGGLFDPNLHQDYYQIDDVLGKSLHLSTLSIPDDWFKEFFEILETYNFTIDENTSVDIDLSVDPEMLGRIFENLLAEINPETQQTARKATGSYYTPRPIVEYMVDESLVQYLLTKLKTFHQKTLRMVSDLRNGFSNEDVFPNHYGEAKPLKSFGMIDSDVSGPNSLDNSNHCGGFQPSARSELEQKIRNLLDYTIEEIELSEKEKSAVIDALDEIKIIDPACGSGAFPMGMLQKMLLILQKVDPKSLVWLIKQLDKIPNQAIRKSVEDELMNKNWDYIHKMGLIQHSIYGVDIQPIAVELSKLRFFLTLMVDEDINDKAENRGINPLPNLSFKFVAANTLIGLPKQEQQQNAFDKEFIEPKIAKLQKVRENFFHSQGNEKEILKNEFMKVQEDIGITISQNKDIYSDKIANELTNWNPFKDDASDWFDPKWMFGVEGGFDIVIGNPPYGAKISPRQKQYFKNNYYSCQTVQNVRKGNPDTYIAFIELGLKSVNENGTLTYIVPLSVTSSESNISLHQYIEQNCSAAFFTNFSVRPRPIFLNAVVNTSIIKLVKGKSSNVPIYSTKMYRKKEDNTVEKIIKNINYQEVSRYYLEGRYPKISDDIEKNILTKIRNIKTKISNLIAENGSKIYYRFAGGRYFKVITNYPTNSSAETSLSLDKRYANSIGAILSSNLFFWYYQIYSDNLNMKSIEVESFPFPKNKFNENDLKKLEEIYQRYLNDIERNANVRTTSRYANISHFKEYKISKSKKIIDEIDNLIYSFYGLTKEEIEFIINYEISFRISDRFNGL